MIHISTAGETTNSQVRWCFLGRADGEFFLGLSGNMYLKILWQIINIYIYIFHYVHRFSIYLAIYGYIIHFETHLHVEKPSMRTLSSQCSYRKAITKCTQWAWLISKRGIFQSYSKVWFHRCPKFPLVG